MREKIAKYFGVKYKRSQADQDQRPARGSRKSAQPVRGLPAPGDLSFGQGRSPATDTVYPTDIGCYTLGVLPPLSAADYVLCMGSSISTACGISRATGRKTVGFIGDSTFFHSGMTGLADAVYNKHNVLLVVMDNGTTAMTGQQVHPGVDATPFKRDLHQISLEAVVRGLGVEDLHVVKAFNLKKVEEAVQAAMKYEGVSVLISQEMCPLYARRIGKFPKKPVFEVDQAKCKNHRDCLSTLACPAFYLDGDNVMINPDLCIGCTVCAQICPEKAIRPVKQGG